MPFTGKNIVIAAEAIAVLGLIVLLVKCAEKFG